MERINFFLFFFFSVATYAQNLIPNPGFDVISGCPDKFGQIILAEPWVSATNAGTPDLFDECSTASNFIHVPEAGHNFDSYQIQRSGTGYAGIFNFFENPMAEGISEYLETPLTQNTLKGKAYYLRFYVSPAISVSMGDWIYTDAIGMALTDTFYHVDLIGNIPAPLIPIIEHKGQVIKDTTGWTKVSGCYIAKGGENHAIIGNFKTEQQTLVEHGGSAISWPKSSFFYIEDVLMMLFDPLPDTLLLCDGLPKTLNASFLEATYKWNTGGVDSAITISAPGIYTVECFIDECVLRDTIVVLNTGKFAMFQPDTTICTGESIRLIAPLPGNYLWQDGSSGKELQVSSAGQYSVTVTNECGEFNLMTKVEDEECTCNIYVPNVISPNGDGLNDELRAYMGCDFDFHFLGFAVFDRWGELVCSTAKDEEPDWDGRIKGRPATPGLYTWFLKYETIKKGVSEMHLTKGGVTIVR